MDEIISNNGKFTNNNLTYYENGVTGKVHKKILNIQSSDIVPSLSTSTTTAKTTSDEVSNDILVIGLIAIALISITLIIALNVPARIKNFYQ